MHVHSERPLTSLHLYCVAVEAVGTARSRSDAIAAEIATANAALRRAAALGYDFATPIASRTGLKYAQAKQLQAWVGGGSSPTSWTEVYRATVHGFGDSDFHRFCDDKPRLLVVVKSKEGGWLFGGFTAVAYNHGNNGKADPAAFLFSLTNPGGIPEKLMSKGSGREGLFYRSDYSATMGCCPYSLHVAGNANSNAGSFTNAGGDSFYAAATGKGAYPMSGSDVQYFTAEEVVAYTIPL